jgi:glycosyltransferase involved in cell wall biosynthesis
VSVGTPTAVIAAPLYNNADFLPETVESLLGQTEPDLALVLVDDCSTDATESIARTFARADGRVSFHRNATRLGLLENTREAQRLARELYPGARYFAFGSDHDVWHPSWLAQLVAALEAQEDAVMAYPHVQRIDENGEVVSRRRIKSFDTVGFASPRARFTATLNQTGAGDMIYGLFRADELGEVGSYRRLLRPDSLLLAELALRGKFVQVPEVLWSRRFERPATLRRQRAAFFPDGPPARAYLPWWLVHPATILWDYGLRGTGRPLIARGEGAGLAVLAFCIGVWRQIAHRTLTPRNSLMRQVRRAPGRLRRQRRKLRRVRIRRVRRTLSKTARRRARRTRKRILGTVAGVCSRLPGVRSP